MIDDDCFEEWQRQELAKQAEREFADAIIAALDDGTLDNGTLTD